MFAPIATLLVIFSLLFGGGGAAAAAASQSSLPGDPLYQVKAWTESARLSLAANDQARWQVALELTERRAAEIQAQVRAGKSPDDAQLTRYQAQVEDTLRAAESLPGQQALAALEATRDRLLAQIEAMQGLRSDRANVNAVAVLERVMAMLQARIDGVKGVPPGWAKRNQDDCTTCTPTGETPVTRTPRPSKTPPPSKHGDDCPTCTPVPGGGDGAGPGDRTPPAGAVPPQQGDHPDQKPDKNPNPAGGPGKKP